MSRAPEIDPEVLQALVDLRSTYATYRKAKADVAKLSKFTQARNHAAASAHAADMRSIIHTRAERLTPNADALMMLLAAGYALKAKNKRHASHAQLGKAMVDECAAQGQRARLAAEALKAAEVEAIAAARAHEAAQQARLAITGYGS